MGRICEHFLLADVSEDQAQIGQLGVTLDEGAELRYQNFLFPCQVGEDQSSGHWPEMLPT